MIASKEQLLDLIPQRPPMVMIDALTESNDDLYKTEFIVQKDNVFLEDGKLCEAGLIENIAQTAAAGEGYKHFKRNESIPTGFIGAVQKLKIHQLPECDTKITTEVTLDNSVMNVSVISGHVFYQDKVIASCTMKVFLLDPATGS